MKRVYMVATTLAVAILTSCAPDADPESVDPAVRGGDLYQANCASCHGPDLEGAPNWQTPNEDGSYPPPPHDSSGHTWHHPDRVLIEIIRDGSDHPQSRMPSFGDQLSDEEIVAILEFIKSKWGPQERAYQSEITQGE